MDQSNEIQIFCKNIRFLRAKNGLSKRKMARIMGIGVRSLQQIEAGSLPPKIGSHIFFRLHDAFHIRIPLLLTCDLEEADQIK